MELRDMEIFLVLSEELHFGRTAERLHISAARVSQSIKKQERRIGSALFDRTSRSVALTPIGRQLREDLRQAYDLINGGMAQATAAGKGVRGTLRLGVMGAHGHELRPVIDAFKTAQPDCDVEITEFHFSDPFVLLRAGLVDVQLMWLPIREPDLAVGPVVHTEGRVLAVAADSDLAGRESVSLEDLADRWVPSAGTAIPDYWAEAMVPAHTAGGRPIPRGPVAKTFHEVLSLVADGRAICPLNAHVGWYYTPPGIVFVPIHDAPVTEWVLVWRSTADNAHLHAFVQTARDLGPRQILPGS
ncbi:LysR family transcriptional regulator [Yinghuangia seranimata]|uniref:LysR family transcriptional regulator n=1 Tax=Yinghuangia seranimata TaxID=408067 RepID=UPI00248AE493|nr:LysR substrate-binding domain-containing protein [Yinghuangia seranimata]MDI2131315.1 LysR substrate-binding domain-containing protein [Yinghuangia seranimata]